MKHFIDCGTNFFHGLNKFNQIYAFDNSWKIDCFEANPYTFQEASKDVPNILNINFVNEAVWTHDGFIDVNINETLPLDNGTNILKNPPDRDIVYNRDFKWKVKISVPCVDLARVIRESNAEFISIKMDVEGAEFEILDHLIKEDCLKRVDHLFVEFHERFFIDELQIYHSRKLELIKKINEQVKVFREWD